MNKRLSDRKETTAILHYAYSKPNSTKQMPKTNSGIIKNISQTGIFFESTTLPLKQIKMLLKNKIILSISFKIPKIDKPLSATAQLRWYKGSGNYIESNKAGYGLQFINISEDNKQLLKQF